MYGFWRMRAWMWPWAALYCASVTFGMFVWPIVYLGGVGGLILGVISGIPLALITRALWRSAEAFDGRAPELRERYGEWAVVTGASAGIGAAFARAFAREGMSVMLIARREDRLRELAAELSREHGVQARTLAADLSTYEGTEAAAAAVTALDVGVLVNNAGAGYAGAFYKQDLARLRSMVELNCTAPVVLTHRALEGMLARGRGAVIVVASVAGRQPVPLHSVYSATKAFDLIFGEALWVELRERGIDVLALQPGPVATEFEEVAGEARPDTNVDETPEDCVRHALAGLGKRPSVVSGTWMTWVRANANRFAPRAVVAFMAHDFMAGFTPPERR
jgi:short-subunit dehydrogenase